MLPKTLSLKNGDSATSVGNLCQCSVTFPVRVSHCSKGISLSVSACCLWVCHREPLERGYVLLAPSIQECVQHHEIPLSLFLFSLSNLRFLSLSQRRDVPVPSSSWWLLAALSPVAPCPCCTKNPGAGHSTPRVASPVLNGGAGSPALQPAGNTPLHAAQDSISLLCHKGTMLACVPAGPSDVMLQTGSFQIGCFQIYMSMGRSNLQINFLWYFSLHGF